MSVSDEEKIILGWTKTKEKQLKRLHRKKNLIEHGKDLESIKQLSKRKN